MPEASYIKLTVQSDHRDRIQLFYADGVLNNKFREKKSVFSKEISKNKKQEIVLKLKNAPVNKVRLDMGEKPGTLRIYQMAVFSHFSEDVILSASDIEQMLSKDHPGVTLRQHGDFIEITSTHNDPYLIFAKPLIHTNNFLLYGLPLLASLFFFLALQNFDFKRFPAIADINSKHPSMGENINALDGLRGIAVIMVIADHTWGRFTGLGAGGVWLFMSLSGFLLAKPFIQRPDRVLSLDFLSHFFLRRIQRIVPVYYTYIVIIYLLHFHFDEFLHHALFLQGDGHLWVVPQEMFFYILIPPVMVINYLVLRGKPWLVILNLIVLLILANRFLTTDVLSLYGMQHQSLRLYVGVFLSGVIASYLYHGVYLQYEKLLLQKYRIESCFSLIALVLLLFFLLCSTGRIWGGEQIFAQDFFGWFGIAAGVLIFSILAAKQAKVNRVLSSLPLRALSVVSFSLYIFHPLVLNIIHKAVEYYSSYSISAFPLFISTLFISYLLACITYTYIERPFLHQNKS